MSNINKINLSIEFFEKYLENATITQIEHIYSLVKLGKFTEICKIIEEYKNSIILDPDFKKSGGNGGSPASSGTSLYKGMLSTNSIEENKKRKDLIFCILVYIRVCLKETKKKEKKPGKGEGEPGKGEGEPGKGEGEPGKGEGEPGKGEGEPGKGEGEPGKGEGERGKGEGERGKGEGDEILPPRKGR